MKIAFRKILANTQTATLTEGRHVGTVVQIAGLGDQPGYSVGDLPAPCLGVVVQLASTQIAKMMRISESPLSTLFAFLDATLPNPDDYDGDDPLPLALGRPVAIEVTVKNGKYASIASFHRPEDFELSSAPPVEVADQVIIDGPEVFTGDTGKALFLRLHRDIRSWMSKRVRT